MRASGSPLETATTTMVSLRLISAMVLVYCTIVTANPASNAWFMKEMQELVEAKEQMDELIDEREPIAEEKEGEEYEGEEMAEEYEEETPWIEEEYESKGFTELMESMATSQEQETCAACGGTGEEGNPAVSCKAIKKKNGNAASGTFYIYGNSGVVQVYCEMGEVCGGESGGWMRIANVDVSQASGKCPKHFKQVSGRFCAPQKIASGGGCTTPTKFQTHGVRYSRVCGRIKAYQTGSTDAFATHEADKKGVRGVTIDGAYVDGISLTHGRSPRTHIWTFASAQNDQHDGNSRASCPCLRKFPEDTTYKPRVPEFVDDNLFCDTGNQFGRRLGKDEDYKRIPKDGTKFQGNALWDGKSCSTLNGCCAQQQNQPWFVRRLGLETCDNVEIRVCNDEGTDNESFLLSQVELYVQ